MSQQPGLYGLQVFIVEDEVIASMELEDMLADFGCTVAGVAATVDDAMSKVLATDAIDAAILDVHVGGEMIFPIADVLVARGIPFVFSTGYGSADLVRRYPQSPLLNKPYDADTLANILKDFLNAAPSHDPTLR